MNIQTRTDIPDSTYFSMSDVEPHVHADTGELVIFDGKGSRRSWGTPQVNSTIVINADDFTTVHVGFSHKHRGSQGWFYFVSGERKTWAQLPDERRQQVIDARKSAPSWAKHPGKLRSEVAKPNQNIRTAYKLVKVEGDRLISLYDGETEYMIGKRLAQKAQDDHAGGYYAYPTAEGCMALWNAGTLVPEKTRQNVARLAMLEVEMSGTIIAYGSSKFAATYIKPVRVVEFVEV